MATGADIVRRAMLKAGILIKTETPSPDEENDALDSLNSMIASWSNESTFIYARTLENFPLVAGTASYTIGPSQTFNTTRPTYIAKAYVRSGTTDYPVDIITDEHYANIQVKTTQGTPEYLNFNNEYPSATIKLYPVPSQADTLYLLTEKPITTIDRNTDISFPPGWEEALIYNLAVRLSPEYGRPVDEATYAIAMDSKAQIQRAVLKTRTMDCNPVKSDGNIYIGWWN